MVFLSPLVAVAGDASMKLATRKNGTRDGELVVVSRDLMRCVTVPQVAHTLQDALDRWSEVAAGLAEIRDAMNLGGLDAEAPAFDPAQNGSTAGRERGVQCG